jgi:hypothetical protein
MDKEDKERVCHGANTKDFKIQGFVSLAYPSPSQSVFSLLLRSRPRFPSKRFVVESSGSLVHLYISISRFGGGCVSTVE